MLLKKILKIVLFTGITLIGITVSTVFVVIQDPTLLLNQRALKFGAALAAKNGIQVEWEGARFASVSEAFLRKKISLHFDRFCAVTAERSIQGCFSPMEIAATIGFAGLIPRIEVIGPIQALNGKILLKPIAGASPGGPSEEKGGGLPDWFRNLRADLVHVEVIDFEILNQHGPLRGHINVTGVEKDRSISVQTLAGLSGPGFNASLSLDAVLKARKVLDVDYQLAGRYETGPQKLSVKANGSIGAQSMSHVISADLRGLSSEFPHLRTDRCLFSTRSLRTELDCPVETAIPSLPGKKWPRVKFPSNARVLVKADLRARSYPPSPSERIEGSVSLELEPVRVPLFQASGRISSRVAGIPTRFPREGKIDTDCDLNIDVPSFRKVVSFLADTDLAVPAPLNALEGRITLSAKGKLDSEQGSLPIVLRTSLSSKNQALDVDASGVIGLRSARVDVVLKDIKLELPELSVGMPPRFLPDSRIHAPKPLSKKAPSSFTYQARIHTPPENPVRLISNFATAPIPIDVNVTLSSDKPPAGTLGMRNTPVQVFHRNAQIEHLDLALKSPTDQSDVDGKIVMNYSQYVITVLVLGTVDKTQIKLLSDPPLPDNQIVSVLLFGRSLADLSPDQSNSVGNTSAAAESGALSLASLYFLASTPIESVSYDPVTGLVSAQVKIAEGTNVSIGASSAGEKTVGVSKRIGPHWSITTELDRPAESDSSILSALLQWSDRY